MPDFAKSLIADVTAKVKKQLLDSLIPITRKIAEAASELEATLTKPARRAGRRGRGRRRGRAPKGRRAVARTGAAKPKRARTRNPRGTLQAGIRRVLHSEGGPLSLAGIRNEVMKNARFRGRNAKTLYTQIVQAVKKLADIQKTSQGLYALKAGGGQAAPVRRPRKAAAAK